MKIFSVIVTVLVIVTKISLVYKTVTSDWGRAVGGVALPRLDPPLSFCESHVDRVARRRLKAPSKLLKATSIVLFCSARCRQSIDVKDVQIETKKTYVTKTKKTFVNVIKNVTSS